MDRSHGSKQHEAAGQISQKGIGWKAMKRSFTGIASRLGSWLAGSHNQGAFSHNPHPPSGHQFHCAPDLPYAAACARQETASRHIKHAHEHASLPASQGPGPTHITTHDHAVRGYPENTKVMCVPSEGRAGK